MTFKVKIVNTMSKDQVKNIVDCIKAVQGVESVAREYKKRGEKKDELVNKENNK